MSQQESIREPSMKSNRSDMVSFLKGQHEQIKKLFGSVLNAKGAARAAFFVELKELMSVHEAGEEAIVHPVAAKILVNGEVVVRERLHEENKAKRAIAAIDHMDVDKPEFDDKLRALQADVIAHAEAEEREEFEKLAAQVDPTQLQRMLTDLQSVEKSKLQQEQD
jgi:hemerythrin superfamily protein